MGKVQRIFNRSQRIEYLARFYEWVFGFSFFNGFILQFINFLKNLSFWETDKTKLTRVVCIKTFAIFSPIFVGR
jgi:hypothetical protein